MQFSQPPKPHIVTHRRRGSTGRRDDECLYIMVRCVHILYSEEANTLHRYFTLAHEIAHNLVSAHNSEHEFYFSSICEVYLPAFIKLVSGK